MSDEVRELLDKLEKTDGAPLIWFNKKLYEYPKEIERLTKIVDALEKELIDTYEFETGDTTHIKKVIKQIKEEI